MGKESQTNNCYAIFRMLSNDPVSEKGVYDAVIATNTPVREYNFATGEFYNEYLIPSGVKVRGGRSKVPLLDSHQAYESDGLKGSVSDIVPSEKEVRAKVRISKTEDKIRQKIDEGILTDISVRAKPLKEDIVREGETKTFGSNGGLVVRGPAIVVLEWELIEASITPIGKDVKSVLKRSIKEKFSMEPKGKVKNKEPDKNLSGNEDELLIERKRVDEILGICRKFNIEPDEYISRGQSLEEVNKDILDKISSADKPRYMTRVEIGKDEIDSFRSAAVDGLTMRCGIPLDKPAEGADECASFDFSELARKCLKYEGKPSSGNRNSVIERAMTADMFPYILSTTTEKVIFDGWDTAEETWSKWVDIEDVSDFNTHNSVGISAASDLAKTTNSEYTYGSLGDFGESFSIDTYGKIFAIPRKVLVNDELGFLSNLRVFGEAASRKVGDLVYSVLTSNPTMRDGVALFNSSSHSNVGTGGSLSVTTISEAIKLAKQQTDEKEKTYLNINLPYFIGPVALEGSSEVFFRSEMLDVTSGSSQNNIFSGSRFERVYDPRLDDSSETAYYFSARKGKGVTAVFLNGQVSPTVEVKSGWSRDGIEYKVSLDCGAFARDWRGLVKNAGV